jgi:hypothetical protein
MANEFRLAEYETIRMLQAAGVPPKGSERPWLKKGDQILWFKGDDLRAKRIEPKDVPLAD